MNPDQPSREQIEARITALLLGELPADEAALLRYTMAQDPALQQLHDELQSTLVLVREAAKHPADAPVEKSAPLKLSAERRQKLLAHFKTQRTTRTQGEREPLFWLRRIEMPWLVPVLAAVAIIAVLAAMLLPATKHLSNSRGTYGSDNALSFRTWSANNAPAAAMKASPAQPPSGKFALMANSEPAPQAITLAPEAQLAAPLVAPPAQMVLPLPESAPEVAAQAGAPAEAGKDGVKSQNIVGSVNVPLAAGETLTMAPPTAERPAGQTALNYDHGQQNAAKLASTESVENKWIVPAQDTDSSVERPLIEAQREREQKKLIRSGNSEGFFASTPANSQSFARNDAGVDRSIGGYPPYKGGHGFAMAGPIVNGNEEASPAAGLPPASAAEPLGQFPAITPSGISDGYANEQKLFTARVIQRPKTEPGQKSQPEFSDSPQSGAMRSSAVAGIAGNKFYGGPAHGSAEKKVPLLGDVPVVGSLFQNSANPSPVASAPIAAPAATAAAAFKFDTDDGRLQGAEDLNGAKNTFNSTLNSAGNNTFAGGAPVRAGTTVTYGTAPVINAAEIKSGALSDSFNLGLANGAQPLPSVAAAESGNFDKEYTLKDAERKRELQSDKANKNAGRLYLPQSADGDTSPEWVGALNQPVPDSSSGRAPQNRNHFVTRHAYTIPNSAAVDQLQSTNYVQVNGIVNNTFNPDISALQPETTQEHQKNQPYDAANRDLEQKLKMHELLDSKLEAEKLDSNLPENSMVQLTDPAQPGRSQNIWQRLTGQVESKARIKIENDVADIQGFAGQPAVASFDPYFIQTTFEIMQSEAVLGKVVDALNLQSVWADKNGGEKLNKSQAIVRLKQQLDLHPVKNTKLIEIGVTSNDPKESADIANAVAKAYADYRVESRQTLTTSGLAVLEDQVAQQQKEIQLAQAKVEQLAQQSTPEPAPEPTDLPSRRPAPNAPVPQPEILTSSNKFSTFSLNVSDVSFKFAEASLQNGKLPDTASIRSEEFINAFDYRDPEAAEGQPMAFTSERARYPFAYNRELLRFAVKTAAAGRQAGRALNLVLLLDNSGSMERADRVAIIREALRVLAAQLEPQDTVSVVTFARTARLWADGVSGDKAGETLDQVGGITPEGGTNLEEAMRLAYETARRHYLAGGMNRVVLLTDGAANLGNVNPNALKQKVEAQRKQGIALDCFGIGWEDYNDDLLEQLSSSGDGRYAFLNSPEDASKDFAAKLTGALQIAAADVKVQVEFNPGRVISYRQIGYATHQLTKEQFRDNTVAAGQIAAQEAGNALYTIETNPNGDGPIATVHVRYKVPGTDEYREHSWDVAYTGGAPALAQTSPAMRLAATASGFSEWLAASPYAQEVTLDELLKDLSGVPEIYGADDRPKQLETMIREAKSLQGK